MVLWWDMITGFFLAVLVYTYIGYGIILGILVKLRPRINEPAPAYLPTVAHVIPAYNEENYLREKIRNSLDMSYPENKYRVIVVTDGSTDGSEAIANQFSGITHLHYPGRKGKSGAINRALSVIQEEVIVVSDANSLLNEYAIRHIVQPFHDQQIGVVAGEKRILHKNSDKAAGAGEGLYWKYESLLKKWDGELYSVVGAAGELFAVRRQLLHPIEASVILEDFVISLDLASQGYRTAYAPDAIATEESSATIEDELKRKVRIAAGGFQAMWILRHLLNIFKYGILSFQYISHRVLRWTLAPLGLPVVFVGSGWLALQGDLFYSILFILQCIFYSLALIGAIFRNSVVKRKIFFVPFYFTMMNYAVYLGFMRFVRKGQSSVWEKTRN